MRAVWAGGGVLGWTNDHSTLAGLKSHKGINLRRYLEVPSNHRKRTLSRMIFICSFSFLDLCFDGLFLFGNDDLLQRVRVLLLTY